MRIGQAYPDMLTEFEQEILFTGFKSLLDALFLGLEYHTDPESKEYITAIKWLPRRYRYKYTREFLQKFTVCVSTVAWKLAQPEHKRLASLAEELAVWSIVNEGRFVIEQRFGRKQAKKALNAFIDRYFEDLDFLFLYEDQYDGIDEIPELAEAMGMPSLALGDWFTPFSDEPEWIPHPYVR